MKHIADIITLLRLAASIAMLFTVPLSAPFLVLYTVGGVSDMIDGTLARRLGTAGASGARLDSIADLAFVLSAALRLLPVLYASLPFLSLQAICTIAAVKVITAAFGAVKFRRLCFLHTRMNKLAGAAVFLLPYFSRTGFFTASVYAACLIALLAAAEEFVCAVKMKEYSPDTEGLFHS